MVLISESPSPTSPTSEAPTQQERVQYIEDLITQANIDLIALIEKVDGELLHLSPTEEKAGLNKVLADFCRMDSENVCSQLKEWAMSSASNLAQRTDVNSELRKTVLEKMKATIDDAFRSFRMVMTYNVNDYSDGCYLRCMDLVPARLENGENGLDIFRELFSRYSD